MMMKIESRQAQALAAFIATIRPDWDQAGIYAALGKAKDMGTVHELAHAAIRAAGDETNRTPAVIAMQGQHWTAPSALTTNPAVAEACPVHEHIKPAHNCVCCRSEWLGSGVWPAKSKHHQAPQGLPEDYTDARTRASEGDER